MTRAFFSRLSLNAPVNWVQKRAPKRRVPSNASWFIVTSVVGPPGPEGEAPKKRLRYSDGGRYTSHRRRSTLHATHGVGFWMARCPAGPVRSRLWTLDAGDRACNAQAVRLMEDG